MKAIVYQHEDHEGPCLLGPALEQAGFKVFIRLREVRAGDESAELVVSLGGPMAVYEASSHPYLLDELRVIRTRVEQDKPVIGICLGAQLLAAAAGSKVYPGDRGMERGVKPIFLTKEGRSDPLFEGLGDSIEVAHWHADTFDPIPGATLLATSELYRWQAFRLNRSIGLQFHPELEPATFEQWLEDAPDSQRLDSLAQAQPALKLLLARLASEATEP